MVEAAVTALPAEEAEGKKGRWRAELDLPADAPLILEIGPGPDLGTGLVLAGNLFVLRQGRRPDRRLSPSGTAPRQYRAGCRGNDEGAR